MLLNDDVEAISDSFLAQLIAPLEEPDVGMTGARLASRTAAPARRPCVLRRRAHAPLLWADHGNPGPFAALRVSREVSGLTAACVALRRETYERVGGLCEVLSVNFNDVDLC